MGEMENWVSAKMEEETAAASAEASVVEAVVGIVAVDAVVQAAVTKRRSGFQSPSLAVSSRKARFSHSSRFTFTLSQSRSTRSSILSLAPASRMRS